MSIQIDLQLGRGRFDLQATVEMPDAGVTALAGHSGSGKTSLLRCLAGLEPRARGRIRFAGETWLDTEHRIHTPAHKRRIGYVFQHAALFPHLSVAKNLQYASARSSGAPRLSFDEVVQLTNLADLMPRSPTTLSGGERQRVALARALLSNSRLLLLDEPVSALDHAAKEDLLARLQAVARRSRLPVVYVSHNLAEAARLAEFAVVMDAGKVVACGPAASTLPAHYPHGEEEAEPFSLIHGSIAHHDDESQLTTVDSSCGALLVPKLNGAAGTPVKLVIRARDVGIALEPPVRTSFLNALPGEVAEAQPFDAAQILLTIRCHQELVRSLLTRKSAQALNIQPGGRVYTLIKSVNLAR